MSDRSASRVTPVILAGGGGTRLWPLSTPARPKQMLTLIGERTMLEATLDRVSDPRFYAPSIIVTGQGQADQVAAVADECAAIIVEPCGRNTAPAIALAALNAAGDDVLLVLPSDHVIGDQQAFDAAVAAGLSLARDGWIVTFGMEPDRAETGYGYIARGDPLTEGAWQVRAFVEKPDAATAETFLADPAYSWNSGMFLLRADALLAGLELHAPDLLASVKAAAAAQTLDGPFVRPERDAFAGSSSVSIDYALMEKADRVAVIPAALGWSDIGSWESLHQASDRDEAGNSLGGNAVAIDSRGCLTRSDGPQITLIGVKDLVVIATADAVLVVPRAQSQRVKELVERLQGANRPS